MSVGPRRPRDQSNGRRSDRWSVSPAFLGRPRPLSPPLSAPARPRRLPRDSPRSRAFGTNKPVVTAPPAGLTSVQPFPSSYLIDWLAFIVPFNQMSYTNAPMLSRVHEISKYNQWDMCHLLHCKQGILCESHLSGAITGHPGQSLPHSSGIYNDLTIHAPL